MLGDMTMYVNQEVSNKQTSNKHIPAFAGQIVLTVIHKMPTYHHDLMLVVLYSRQTA